MYSKTDFSDHWVVTGVLWSHPWRAIFGPWFQIVKSMPNFGYWCIFTCSIDLEGSPLDPSNGMLQIAAYLQHISCTWQFLIDYECIKDETQHNVSLKSNHTSYQISWCCSNQKCCCNMLQHICGTFVANGGFSKIMNSVKMKLRI